MDFGKAKVLWEIDLPRAHQMGSNHLDIGCGVRPRNPFRSKEVYACDLLDPKKVSIECKYEQCDITLGLPYDSNYFTSVSAYDVLEHVPRIRLENGKTVFPFVRLMSEIHRVLKPGGFFYAVTPMFPSIASFSDPTHVNHITLETVSYFGNSSHARSLGYGFDASFEIVFANWLKGAGPFSSGESLFEVIETSGLSSQSISAGLKLANRYFRRLINRNPTHGLWVLKKHFS